MGYPTAREVKVLAEFLEEVCEAERRTENRRQIVVESKSFHSVNLFNKLARDNGKSITFNDFKNFVRVMNLPFHHDDIHSMFYLLDLNNDGVLDREEFVRMLLHPEPGFSDKNPIYQPLLPDVELSLARVLQEEMNGIGTLDKLRSKLRIEVSPTFLDTIFHMLDLDRKSYLDLRDIYEFMSRNLEGTTYSKAGRVLRRMDRDNDKRVSKREWLQAFNILISRNVYENGSFADTRPSQPKTNSRHYSDQRQQYEEYPSNSKGHYQKEEDRGYGQTQGQSRNAPYQRSYPNSSSKSPFKRPQETYSNYTVNESEPGYYNQERIERPRERERTPKQGGRSRTPVRRGREEAPVYTDVVTVIDKRSPEKAEKRTYITKHYGDGSAEREQRIYEPADPYEVDPDQAPFVIQRKLYNRDGSKEKLRGMDDYERPVRYDRSPGKQKEKHGRTNPSPHRVVYEETREYKEGRGTHEKRPRRESRDRVYDERDPFYEGRHPRIERTHSKERIPKWREEEYEAPLVYERRETRAVKDGRSRSPLNYTQQASRKERSAHRPMYRTESEESLGENGYYGGESREHQMVERTYVYGDRERKVYSPERRGKQQPYRVEEIQRRSPEKFNGSSSTGGLIDTRPIQKVMENPMYANEPQPKLKEQIITQEEYDDDNNIRTNTFVRNIYVAPVSESRLQYSPSNQQQPRQPKPETLPYPLNMQGPPPNPYGEYPQQTEPRNPYAQQEPRNPFVQPPVQNTYTHTHTKEVVEPRTPTPAQPTIVYLNTQQPAPPSKPPVHTHTEVRTDTVTSFKPAVEDPVRPSNNTSSSSYSFTNSRISPSKPTESDLNERKAFAIKYYGPAAGLDLADSRIPTSIPYIKQVTVESETVEVKDYLNDMKAYEERFANIPESEKKELIAALKRKINLIRDIEKARVELAYAYDFNMMDFYRCVKKDPTSAQIGLKDFNTLFQDLNVMALDRDVKLVFYRGDRDSDMNLSYQEVVELLAPFSPEPREELNVRKTQGVSKLSEYSEKTRRLLCSCLEALAKYEYDADGSKEVTQGKTYSLFNLLDRHNKGYIVMKDWADLLERFQFSTSEQELLALMRRFDFNQNGRISLSEFIDEMGWYYGSEHLKTLAGL